jgi:hypothetical protein
MILEGAFWSIVHLEGIVSLLFDLYGEIASLLVVVLLGVIDVAGIIVYLSDSDDSELFYELFIGEEKYAVFFVFVADSIFLLLGHLVPVLIVV